MKRADDDEVIDAEVIETSLAQRKNSLARKQDPYDDLYTSFLESKGKTTANLYRTDFRHFASWLELDSPTEALSHLCKMTGPAANRLVFNFRAHLSGAKGARVYSPATINRRLSALKSATKLARMFGLISWSLEVEGVPVRTYKDTSGCGVEGMERLLVEIAQQICAHTRPSATLTRLYRDQAILHLLYYGGLRRKEPLTIHYPDGVRERGDIPEVRITGKKRKEQEWVPVGHKAFQALSDWVRLRGDAVGPLFPSKKDPSRPIHVSSVNNLVNRLAEAAGVEVTPHGLRHTAITEVLERTNGDVRTAQRFARHANPTTTMIYDDARAPLAAQGVSVLEDD